LEILFLALNNYRSG